MAHKKSDETYAKVMIISIIVFSLITLALAFRMTTINCAMVGALYGG